MTPRNVYIDIPEGSPFQMLGKLSCVEQRKVIPFRCTWIHYFQVSPTRTSGDALNSQHANMSFTRNSAKRDRIYLKPILSEPA